MIQIDGLAEVVLNVHDASRAVAFYGGLLGLERITPEGQPGPIFFRAGQATDRVPVAARPGAAFSWDSGLPGTAHTASSGADDSGSRVRCGAGRRSRTRASRFATGSIRCWRCAPCT